MYVINPMLSIDSYKLGHMSQYPEGTTKVYCNLTARSFQHIEGMFPNDMAFFDKKAVVFGLSSSIQEIVHSFETEFFGKNIDELISEFKTTIRPFIGDNDDSIIIDNFQNLHKLGYLPLEFKTLEEWTTVSANIPMMTWTNTHDDFAWLPNYLETIISSQTWKMSTAATIARVYKNIFNYYADLTGVSREFTQIQGHDFSSRGMSGFADSTRTGAGHLTSFIVTDAISSIGYINKYYNHDKSTDVIGVSVPATEHSVMCMGGEETELDTYRNLLKQYPTGVVSIVSDTWDYWDLISNGTQELKEEILSRKPDSLGLAKTVFRPDSGNPVDIICGTSKSTTGTVQEKCSVCVLDEIFSSDVNERNYKTLNQKIGLIYGDSITPIRAHKILNKLEKKGFSSANIVLGIGSFTYQFITRDSLGFAIKATYGEINGKGIQIFKAPKTDSAKKSAKGMLRVEKLNGEYYLIDGLDSDEGGYLKTIFKDGSFQNLPTFKEIRERLDK